MGVLLLFLSLFLACLVGCAERDPGPVPEPTPHAVTAGDLTIDQATGIPFALTFQFPVRGFNTTDFGFGFGSVNTNFCMVQGANGCQAYGVHIARDTVVGRTPTGTDVLAPADGIVRVTTDLTFGGYGADSSANTHYQGCALVLEHEFANGEAVTTLLGHIACENNVGYDTAMKQGNPKVGTIVRRGDYVAHVAHYWHGAGSSVDWHHLHWGMRKGRFAASSYTHDQVAAYVRGYAPKSEFTTDPSTNALIHPEWIDPFLIVAANGDPALEAASGVRHHPPGSLLEDANGGYWVVLNSTDLASVPPDVVAADRYDVESAVRVSADELDCYAKALPAVSQGAVHLYKRPNSSTVVMAYEAQHVRYDVIRWEALLSYGYDATDISSNASNYESSYTNRGYRTLRPGTLVKADEESEVSIVTPQNTRLPIAGGDVFEALGYRWERVVSVPKSVIDLVAGPRENATVDYTSIHACAVAPPCPNGGNCAGGGLGCVPDTQKVCACVGGLQGVQTCAPDGMSYDQCDCTGEGQPEGSGGYAGSSGAGGSGGTPFDGGTAGSGGAAFDAGSGGVSCLCPTGVQIACACLGGGQGVQVCQSDCQSYGACQCPSTGTGGAGGAAYDAGSSGSGPVDSGAAGSGGSSSQTGAFHLLYTSPVAGPLHIEGWWTGRGWDKIVECTDTNPSDTALECDLPVPSGTSLFQFQIYLSNGKYWGDQACSSGGCGQPLGQLTLTKGGASVSYSFQPNQSGPPYYNGQVAPVP